MLPLDGESWLRVEVVKPVFDSGNLTFLSSAINVAAFFPVSDRLLLDVELPFALAAVSQGPDRPSRTFGNPFVGVRTRPGDGGGAAVRAGIRLPLQIESEGDGFATGVGAFSDLQRFERYLDDYLSLVSAGTFGSALGEKGRVGFEAGTVVTIPTRSGDTDLWLIYGAGFDVSTGPVRIGADVEGRLLATEPGLTFGERSAHHLNVEGTLLPYRIRPRVKLGVPLDDDVRGFLSYIVGIGVDVPLW